MTLRDREAMLRRGMAWTVCDIEDGRDGGNADEVESTLIMLQAN